MFARVILVSTFYHPVIGGAEAAAAGLAGYLKARGHQILVLTKRTSVDALEHEVVRDVPVWRRPPLGARSAAGKWLFLPWAFAGLVARRRDYDVIFVSDQRATGLAGLAAARLLRRPLIVQPQTQATIDGRHPLKRGWRARLHRLATSPIRYCYARAEAIVCITRSIVAEGRHVGVDDARLHYLPNSVDISRFRPADAARKRELRLRYGLPIDSVLFAFTGRLSREKGVRELLAAWSRVASPRLHLVLIGPDMPGHPWDEGAWVREFVAREQLDERVTLLGARSHAEVAELQSAADAAVLPSHFEALPVAAIEAMAAGLPLVASNVGGVPDFVIDGENGLLVEAHDVEGLTTALARVANDADWRMAAGQAARRTAERFSADVVLEELAALIDRVAGTHAAARGR